MSSLDLSGKIRLSADDTCILYCDNTINEIKEKIKDDLGKIGHWLNAHRLTLNTKKSSYMLFNNQIMDDQRPIFFGINNYKLSYSTTIKYLGLYIDETLSWEKHISYLRKKLSAPVGILKQLSYLVPLYLLRTVYFSLVHSHLQYLAILWFPTGKSLIKPIMVLQNRAIKNIYNLPFRYNTKNLYINFKIMPLESIYKYQVSVYIHQVIQGARHSNITFTYRNSIHEHNTRHRDDLELAKVTTEKAKNSIFFKGVQVYNKIPRDVRSLNTKKFIQGAKSLFQPKWSHQI